MSSLAEACAAEQSDNKENCQVLQYGDLTCGKVPYVITIQIPTKVEQNKRIPPVVSGWNLLYFNHFVGPNFLGDSMFLMDLAIRMFLHKIFEQNDKFIQCLYQRRFVCISYSTL